MIAPSGQPFRNHGIYPPSFMRFIGVGIVHARGDGAIYGPVQVVGVGYGDVQRVPN